MKVRVSKSARKSVTLPSSLKERMEEVEERVDWSRVARLAFEEQLAVLKARRKVRHTTESVNHVRMPRSDANGTQFNRGYSAGRAWAERAEWIELNRLDRLRRQLNRATPDGWSLLFTDNAAEEWTVSEILAGEILAAGDSTLAAVAPAFWQRALPNDGSLEKRLTDSDYMRGFAEAALEYWGSLEAEL